MVAGASVQVACPYLDVEGIPLAQDLSWVSLQGLRDSRTPGRKGEQGRERERGGEQGRAIERGGEQG